MKRILQYFSLLFIAGFSPLFSVYAGGVQEGAFTVHAGFTVVFDADLEASALKTETVTITGYGAAFLNGNRQQALTTAKARARTQLALQTAGNRFTYRAAEDEVLFTVLSSAEISGARPVETKELTGPDESKTLITVITAEQEIQLPPKSRRFTVSLEETGDSVDSLFRTLLKEAVRTAVEKQGHTATTVRGVVYVTGFTVQ